MGFLKEREEFVYWARLLNQKGFVTGRSGNVSYKVGEDKILITAHDSYLGYLEESDILLVNSAGDVIEGKGEVTSEKFLHLNVYKHNGDARVVLHAHSPFTTAFYYYYDTLDIFSFETRFYLGNVPVVAQATPTVIDIAQVIAALEKSNIMVLKNHGIVSIGKNFKEAFSLIELLEEQAKINMFIKRIGVPGQSSAEPQPVGRASREEGITTVDKRYKMLSAEHRQRLTEVVNNDSDAQRLGQQFDLTCTLAVKNQDTGEVMCFHYQKGKIVIADTSEDAEFMIIGKPDILRKVFNREIDPFVAATQGKVKTKGDFARLSKWYPVMVRTFKLWEQAPVE